MARSPKRDEGACVVTDRYLKFLLTVIALELLWLAASGPAPAVSAQGAATPVIITGVQLDPAMDGNLPVSVRGSITFVPLGPIKVEADHPLPVQSVPYTPSARPGD
jgi:hypothetical protein